jgi:hypothetical protein
MRLVKVGSVPWIVLGVVHSRSRNLRLARSRWQDIFWRSLGRFGGKLFDGRQDGFGGDARQLGLREV